MSDPQPSPDAVVEDINAAPTDEETIAIEAEVIEQTDNGLQEGDPAEQPANPEDDGE